MWHVRGDLAVGARDRKRQLRERRVIVRVDDVVVSPRMIRSGCQDLFGDGPGGTLNLVGLVVRVR